MADQATTDPAPVAADTATKPPKQRRRKEPTDFGVKPEVNKDFDVRDAIEKIVAAGKGQDKGVLRRELLKPSGIFHFTLANYLTPTEIRAIAIAEAEGWPNEGIKTKGYGTKDGRVVKNLDEVIQLAGERRVIWQEKEKVRAPAREALRSEYGSLLEEYPGKSRENRVARMRTVLDGKTWVVMSTADDTVRATEAEEPIKIQRTDRFYDIDVMAGRGSYFVLRPEADLKKDGTLAAKATGKTLRMSPVVYEDLVRGDAEFEPLIAVPEGFLQPKPREPKAEATATDGEAPKPKRQRRKTTDNTDLLARADEDAGMPEAEQATTADDILEDAPAEPADDLADVALPEGL